MLLIYNKIVYKKYRKTTSRIRYGEWSVYVYVTKKLAPAYFKMYKKLDHKLHEQIHHLEIHLDYRIQLIHVILYKMVISYRHYVSEHMNHNQSIKCIWIKSQLKWVNNFCCYRFTMTHPKLCKMCCINTVDWLHFLQTPQFRRRWKSQQL